MRRVLFLKISPSKSPFILKPGGHVLLFLKKYLDNYKVHFIAVKILWGANCSIVLLRIQYCSIIFAVIQYCSSQ